MTGAATDSPATSPGTSGWQVRPARPEDAAAVATASPPLLCELGAPPPSHASIEAEASAHIDDPSLGVVLIATADAMSSQKSSDSADNCELAGGGDLVGVLTR